MGFIGLTLLLLLSISLKLQWPNPQSWLFLISQNPFIIECDALGFWLEAVLMQDHKPIAYHSQASKGKHLYLSTYETELLALAIAVKKWRPYLLGKPSL